MDGLWLGCLDGLSDGEGDWLGFTEGLFDGLLLGETLGLMLGLLETEEAMEGLWDIEGPMLDMNGPLLGDSDGIGEGPLVGLVGAPLGKKLGLALGSLDFVDTTEGLVVLVSATLGLLEGILEGLLESSGAPLRILVGLSGGVLELLGAKLLLGVSEGAKRGVAEGRGEGSSLLGETELLVLPDD